MAKKNTLTTEFSKAAAEGVPLTTKETALLKGIFGQEFKTDHVRKHHENFDEQYGLTYTSGKKNIYFQSKYKEQDYSQSQGLLNYGTFVHEMTHIWQYNNMVQNLFRAFRKKNHVYDYKLSQKSRFKDFGIEQQAAMVGDYAQMFLYQGPEYKYTHFLVGGDVPQNLALLKKVVEDRLPEARKTRLALEAQKVSPLKQAPKMR
jgi:hypothetical protein